jgi:hypothetical protein
LGYIVKCPQCGEVNSGSRLTCVKCENELTGIPREQDNSEEAAPKEKVAIPPIPGADKKNRSYMVVGFLVGICGFLLISFFTIGGSFCGGLFFSLGIGIAAGLFSAHYAHSGPIETVTRRGAIAGGIAGVFSLLGQTLGGALIPLMFGTMQVIGYARHEVTVSVNDLMIEYFWPGLINGVLGLVICTVMGAFAARFRSNQA